MEYPTAQGHVATCPVRETVVAVPARGARTGSPANNRRDGPGASKTHRAGCLSFAETVLKLSSPGEGPGAPPCLPLHRFAPSGADPCPFHALTIRNK